MNGAERLLRDAVAQGVRVCFANPGTTELTMVSALDAVAEIKPVLCLFEGVATGAADGFGRMSGGPALTITHLGPSFSNGLANLHNARRARTPILNLIGDNPARHRRADPPLTTDIASLAKTVGWVREVADASSLRGDFQAALSAARSAPRGVASLVIPADVQWGEAVDVPAPPLEAPAPPALDEGRVRSAAEALRRGEAALLLGGATLSERGLLAAGRIAAAVGCKLMVEGFPARLECGVGLPAVMRMPYVRDFAEAALDGVSTLVLAGAVEPVSYFGYPDEEEGSLLPPEVKPLVLASPTEEPCRALEALADALGAPAFSPKTLAAPTRPSGALNGRSLVAAIASTLPREAIVIDEGVSLAGAFLAVNAGAPRHSYLSLTGGACGMGLPAAIGAAIACPERRVIALVGDGSALYTAQALWTHAREALNITVVVCANDAYRILQLEQDRLSADEPGERSRSLTELTNPSVSWESLAKGYGVPSSTATSADELVSQLERSFAQSGPHLIQARLV